MKKIILVLLALALCIGAAAAEDAGILGKPFPDFTVTDTDGNTFTLSEALKGHEAALINIWATWCPPCRSEFPDLNEVYERYGDRVAFIALSSEDDDTLEIIGDFRRELGLTLPMGRDENGKLGIYINGGTAIPATVVVDRFGNAVFTQTGSFAGADEVERVIRAFLGDGYTETVVLDRIPRETSTGAFPVSAGRALRLENENVKRVVFHAENSPEPVEVLVVNDDTAHIRLELAVSDIPGDMIYYDLLLQKLCKLPTLLDPERNAYVYDQEIPAAGEESAYNYGCLVNYAAAADPDYLEAYMIRDEGMIEDFAELLRASGYEGVTWEYAEAVQAEANTAAQAYILHVTDQDGTPVPDVYVNFCTDTACTPCRSDANGTITFEGAQDNYHVQLMKVPEGFRFDEGYEMYTGSSYGEWLLRIERTGVR